MPDAPPRVASATAPRTTLRDRLGHALHARRAAKVAELVAFVAVTAVVLAVGLPFAGGDLVATQLVIWVANIAMLLTIALGLYLRRQPPTHFGLSFRLPTLRTAVTTVLLSVVVFLTSALAFAAGAVVTAIIYGRPEQADMSGYDYLQGNLPLFLVSLAGVYVASSFGEEVTYRAFLINRIAELLPDSRHANTVALIVSSLVFGLVHSGWGIPGMIQTTCMGLALGAWYLRLRDNLWINVLAHAYLDTLLLVPLYLQAPSS